MKVTVVVDNIPSGDLKGEWGLCFFIEYGRKKYLLDTGASSLFLSNASALGIDISQVDCAVLSHAHYDHSLGMAAFFDINSKAKFHVSASTKDNCYAKALFVTRYIGIEKGILSKYPDRISYCSGITNLDEGVWIVPHSTEGLAKVGKKNHMYVDVGSKLVPDDFSHEQTLVFKVDSGLVVFNSCSHAGADVIISEVRKAFPCEEIIAYLGGLHLAMSSSSRVKEIARGLGTTGVKKIITGHCTGDKAFAILKDRLGDAVCQFRTGMVMEF